MPSPTTRAKFVCASSTGLGSPTPTTVRYQFRAVTDDDVPEGERFHKYTPAGSLDMCVDNPAVSFEPGASYYLDFTRAD